MEEKLENQIIGYEKCAKLAEFNSILALTGTSVSTIMTGDIDYFGLIMLGISMGLLSFDIYQLYKLDKEVNSLEKKEVKQLIKLPNQSQKKNI